MGGLHRSSVCDSVISLSHSVSCAGSPEVKVVAIENGFCSSTTIIQNDAMASTSATALADGRKS